MRFRNQNFKLVEMLKEKEMKISFAESCTAGLLAGSIGGVSGASSIFDESYVTYANEAKTKILGVSENTLKEHGAVSHQVAKEMSKGLKRVSGADIAVSVTGIAGPTGGTAKKPVGLVYIGITSAKGTTIYKKIFSGARNKIRNKIVDYAINKIIKIAEEC